MGEILHTRLPQQSSQVGSWAVSLRPWSSKADGAAWSCQEGTYGALNPLGPQPCQVGCSDASPCAGDQRRQNMIDALSKDDWSAVIEQQTEQTLGHGAAAANGAPQASQWVPCEGQLSGQPCKSGQPLPLGFAMHSKGGLNQRP